MTIASEITRLQWAKADARTSIINKWVDVPANASVEDYHTYIDQIKTSSWIWTFTGTMALRYVWPYSIDDSIASWCISLIHNDYLFIAMIFSEQDTRNILYPLFIACPPWATDWTYVYLNNLESRSDPYIFKDYGISTTDDSISITIWYGSHPNIQWINWYVQGTFSFNNNSWTVTKPSSATMNQWWQDLFTSTMEDDSPLVVKFAPNLSNN